jgi:hypothetical protein
MSLDRLRAELAARGEIRLRVKVTPKASRNEVTGSLADGTLKVRVQAPPEKGKANAALRALLAEQLGVAARQVSILSGETSPLKHIRVSRG